MQKALRVDLLDKNQVEFTYLEVLNEKVEYTHSIQVDINEFEVMKKMLEVLFGVKM